MSWILFLKSNSFSGKQNMPRPGTKQWLIVDAACLTSSPPPVPDNGSILVLSTNNQPRPSRQANIPDKHISQRRNRAHIPDKQQTHVLVFLGSAFNLGSDWVFIRGGQLKNWFVFSKNSVSLIRKSVSDSQWDSVAGRNWSST